MRAAAKNFADVLVVVSPADYDAVLEAARSSRRSVAEFRFELARKAFAHTGRYDTAIAADAEHGHGRRRRVHPCSPRGSARRAVDRSAEGARSALRRESPPARRALRRTPAAGPGCAGAAGQGALVHEPARSRCGARIVARVRRSRPPRSSSTRTRAAPPPARAPPMPTSARAMPIRSSAFGGIVGLNRPIDAETARAIVVDPHRGGHRAGGG